jgi:hypothetical protein
MDCPDRDPRRLRQASRKVRFQRHGQTRWRAEDIGR